MSRTNANSEEGILCVFYITYVNDRKHIIIGKGNSFSMRNKEKQRTCWGHRLLRENNEFVSIWMIDNYRHRT